MTTEAENKRRYILEQRIAYYRARLTVMSLAIDAFVAAHGNDSDAAKGAAAEHLQAIYRNVLNDLHGAENELDGWRKSQPRK